MHTASDQVYRRPWNETSQTLFHTFLVIQILQKFTVEQFVSCTVECVQITAQYCHDIQNDQSHSAKLSSLPNQEHIEPAKPFDGLLAECNWSIHRKYTSKL